MVTMNKKNRFVPPFSNCARLYKMGGYISDMKNRDAESSAAQSDFGGISEVTGFRFLGKNERG